MTKSERVELRVTPELLKRVDAARGDVPRSKWIESAINLRLGPPAVVMVGRDRFPAPSVEEVEARLDAVAPDSSSGKGKTSRPVQPAKDLPKIAKRHWS